MSGQGATVTKKIARPRVEVRRYGPTDAGQCSKLFLQLVEAHRTFYKDPTIGGSDPARSFRTRARGGRARNMWVAVESGRIVGLMGLLLHRGYGEVEPVVVAEFHRRRGVASLLIERAIAEARRRGWKRLTIRPVARNAAALRTFYSLGFRTLGHVELNMWLQEPGPFAPLSGPKVAGRRFEV